MVADRRAGPAGVAAAGRAELPVEDTTAGRARWPALAPSRGAGGGLARWGWFQDAARWGEVLA